ncbi:MAG: redoxin domain-containing protein [Fuerstiella sp.]|nr:redoxin domain-containing protein [Fuerstiella sp.]
MLPSCRIRCYFLLILVCTGTESGWAQKYTAEQILKPYRPLQKNVEYETPPPAEFTRCRVEVEHEDGNAGFVVYGPAGQVLRRFTDTNGDQNPDVFRYYQHGLEVYRDIDSNFNRKPDQYRWMNLGGTRWGLDVNEDGKIDEWKMISAPEAAQVAIEAMTRNDVHVLGTVLINASDMHQLNVAPTLTEEMLKSVARPAARLKQQLAASRTINKNTKWVRFDPPVPALIPADGRRFNQDLMVYENAMAFVRNQSSSEIDDLVLIGEMVRVGDVWKLTQLPRPLDEKNSQIAIGGILMQPANALSMVTAADSVPEEMQVLLKKLEVIDTSMPGENATAADLIEYNQKRADIIEQIVPLVKGEKLRNDWIRQYADGLAAAVQTGGYPDGLKRLSQLQEQLRKDPQMQGYVWYRRLLAEYAVRLQNSEEEDQRAATQEWWLSELEKYAKKWPKSDDAADAVIQLAISLEIMGRLDDARGWYQRLAANHPRTNGGIRARGALRRLDLTGKKLELNGPSLTGQNIAASQFQGRVLLVVFWATWATPYAKDLPALEAVYTKHRKAGFEVLGVNLDPNAAALKPFIDKYGGHWHHIRDAGGMDGKLARDFGIVSMPTMFLVDRQGIVAGGITTENLDQAVQNLLQGKTLGDASQTPGAAAVPRAKN